MRARRVCISEILLIDWFTEGHEFNVKCISGLPEGTKYISIYKELEGRIWLVVEHKSFSDVKLGDVIPEFEKHIVFSHKGIINEP